MQRRELLLKLGTVVVSIPFGAWWVGCGTDDEDVSTEAVARPDAGGSSLLVTFTSSVTDGHSHQVSFDPLYIAQPPPAGFESDTTRVQDHVHRVVLTEQDFVSMQGGNAVSRSTSFEAGHFHGFAFRFVGT